MAKKKRSRAKSKKNIKKKIGFVYFLFGIGAILVLILIGLILSSIGVFDSSKEIKMFSIKDECSLVMGNLIHQIRDSGDCKIKCINECDIDGMHFNYIEFAAQNNSCNDCYCYCK